jgi:hypothetical protein
MQNVAQAGNQERSIRDLLSELTTKTTDLVRKEIQLAKIEISDNLAHLQKGLISLAIGGVVLLGGFGVLLAASVPALDQLIHQPWISALIVGVVVTGVGTAMLLAGKKEITEDKLAPEKTVESIREDVELVREHI